MTLPGSSAGVCTLLLLWSSVAMALPDGSASSVACIEDPNHNIGDSWECDDKCNTCTCIADGTVQATGRCCGDNCAAGEPDEAFLVKVGFGLAMVAFAAFIGICYLMCCKGGNHKASELVRELEGEE